MTGSGEWLNGDAGDDSWWSNDGFMEWTAATDSNMTSGMAVWEVWNEWKWDMAAFLWLSRIDSGDRKRHSDG